MLWQLWPAEGCAQAGIACVPAGARACRGLHRVAYTLIVASAGVCTCHISPAAVAKTGCNQHAATQQKHVSAQMLCLAMYELHTCSTRHASTRLLRRPPQCHSICGTSASATTLIAGCRHCRRGPLIWSEPCMHTGCQLEADCSEHGTQQHILTTSLWHFRALLLTSCNGVLSAIAAQARLQAHASTSLPLRKWHAEPAPQMALAPTLEGAASAAA